jgi:hypothetical protein
MEFCRLVASRAQEIAIGLVHKQDWRQVFNDTQDSRVRSKLSNSSSGPLRDLLGAAGRLRDAVLKFQCQNGDDPFLVIVLDEASSLLIGEGSGRTQAGRYVALNRIMSCLMEFRIWFFILSTESKLEALLPPSNVERVGDYTTDSSARVSLMGGSPLVPFPPFLALQLDVEDRRRMQNGEQKRIELCKPMSQFSEPKHMAMFGRPLWFAYHDAVEMNWLAKLKLVGGKQGATYNPGDEHHVFAAMSFRLSLDVCVQNPKALHLARSAVNSYMRVVVSVDQNTGVLDTVTPSEPVLAVAAMEHLCKGSNWPSSITTLIAGLLENGLIEKGLRGELYSRVVLTLAHDSVRMAALLRPGGSISRFCPRLVPTFAVKDFLIALYAKDHHESIATIAPQILEARMNFTHFVPAGENLSPGVVLPLCHDLLRRNAAMQLAPAQPTYDKLLPIYFGDEGESFDLSKCGVILVQDKNKETATTPEQVFREDFTKISPKSGKRSRWGTAGSIRNGPYFVFNEMANPILFLLFDMGVATTATAATPLVQVSCSKNIATPHVWAIHSRGHTEKIFGCLETMRCERECARFFASTAPPDGSAHDRLASRNKTFHKLSRSFRYTGFDLGQEQGVGEQDDGRPGTEAEGEDKDVSMDDVQQ